MLTDLEIRRVTFGDPPKPKKLHDSQGLYLLCRPDGARWWRFAYRFGGRHKTISMGVYGKVGLAQARRLADRARELLREGKDPGAERKAAKRRQRAGDSVAAVAREWFGKQQLARSTRRKKQWFLDEFILPAFGRRPIGELAAGDLVGPLLDVEERVSVETAHRVKQTLGQILRYAVATGRASRDVTADLKGALRPMVFQHYAAIVEPEKIGALLRAIDGIDGSPVVRAALRLAPLVFVRPGELRTAAWADVDLDAATCRIPAHKMKMRAAHIVPLATQAVAIFKDLRRCTGASPYVFPSIRSPRIAMSDGTLNAALRRLGYERHEMTAHGFRAMARTVLAEVLLEDPYTIEAQLAHAVPGPLGATYARTQYLTQRRQMMQRWADYLDGLRESARREKGGAAARPSPLSA